MERIGLIGYGRFGRLAAKYLSRHAVVLVYDARRRSLPGRSARIRPATLRQVASLPVVVLAVPISGMRAVLRRIARYCVPGALVVDVCTVKEQPIRWMREMLPRHVSIIGTHPMFGPDSDTGTLRGQRIVLCPARGSKRLMRQVTSLLHREGLIVETMSPESHDRLVADMIVLSHFIGRMIDGAGLKRRRNGTSSYRHLLSVVDVATNDSFQLLKDLLAFNRFSGRVLRGLLGSARRLASRLR